MSNLALTKKLSCSVDQACERVTEAIKNAGFGVLTRIDFDQKIQEKLGENIPRTVILGACNPRLAYEAFRQSTDVALLIPCNVVVRETAPGEVLVEAMRPTKMLDILKDVPANEDILQAEKALDQALQRLAP